MRTIRAVSCCVALMALSVAIRTHSQEGSVAKVSVQLAGETLAEGLPELGQSAGKRVRCGPNAADRRLFLMAYDRPFDEVIVQLRQFVPTPPGQARWYREGSGFVFDEDAESRSARNGVARKRRQESEKKRQMQFGKMQGWSQPKKGDSQGEANGRKQIATDVAIFSGLPLQLQRVALSGQPVRVPFDSLSPQAQTLVYEKVRHFAAGVEGDDSTRFVGQKDYRKVVVETTPTGTPDRPGMKLLLRCPPSPGGMGTRDILNAPVWESANGWRWDTLDRGYRERVRGPEEREKHPALQKRVTITGGEGKTVDVVFGELVRKGEFPLIGEYDPCFRLPYTRGNDPQTLDANQVVDTPLWKVLDIICKKFDLEWEYQHGWIWIRSPRTLLSWSGEIDLSPPSKEPAPATQR
jgi:hypothetical protein